LGPAIKVGPLLSKPITMKPESTLVSITEQVYRASTADQARTAMIEYLKGTRVKDRDKMINEVSKLNNLVRIQQYFSNCLLKFEGLSPNQ
jgi:hypothetical protein